jgi:hypothetical protein
MVKTSDNTNLLGVIRPADIDKALSPKKIGLGRKKYGIDIHFIPKAKNKFKKKRRILSRWKRYKVLAESNRISRLGLRHWGTKEKNWIFAKFDKKIETLRYTDEEYQMCNILDSEWSRKETDTLMELCSLYDLRFHVIQDRFLAALPCKAGERSKTIPELKDRYYRIQRALLQHRDPKNASKGEQFEKAYDKEGDVIRREQLELALCRTKEEHREILRLVEANRKNNQALKQRKKEAKERRKKFRVQQKFIAERLLAGAITKRDCVLATGGLHGYMAGYGTIIKDEWKKQPPPAEGSPLANLPDDAKVQPIPWTSEPRLFSREWRIHQPRHVLVNLTLGNQTKKLIVRNPIDLQKKDIGMNHFGGPPGYLLSVELQRRLESLGFPVTSDSGPFKYPTNVLCLMFNKLRDDLLSLILLEKLVIVKKKRNLAANSFS